MKELKENVKNLQATYQDVFNISETLPLKNTGNKCVVGAQQQHSPSIEEKNNSVSHLKKTVLFMLDLITPPPPSLQFLWIVLWNIISKKFHFQVITICENYHLAPILCVDKANANDINKGFTELINKSNLHYISHENIK